MEFKSAFVKRATISETVLSPRSVLVARRPAARAVGDAGGLRVWEMVVGGWWSAG